MDFTCTTNAGDVNIRVYQYWDETGETWLQRYEELK